MKKNVFFVTVALMLLAAVLAAFWIGGIIMSESKDSKATGAPIDYVVILGCKLEGREPGRCLQSRVDTAAKYLKEHPWAMAVCSGGQGSDEEVAEGKAIQWALIRKGIHKRRIIREEESHNTYENLMNTKKILDARTNGREYRIAVVTNEFHLYRSQRLAEYVGFKNPAMVSAPTPTTLFYQNFAREILAVVASWIRYR